MEKGERHRFLSTDGIFRSASLVEKQHTTVSQVGQVTLVGRQ